MKYSAEEVLQIAIDIERNGQRYYNQAADTINQAEAQQLLRELAEMEVGHEQRFTDMRNHILETQTEFWQLDLDNEEGRYLQAIADGKIFPTTDVWAVEDMPRDLPGILQVAIQREKDAVIFFLAIESTAINEDNKKQIHDIVVEEMSHVRLLSDELAALRE